MDFRALPFHLVPPWMENRAKTDDEERCVSDPCVWAMDALSARSVRISFSSVFAQMTGCAQGDKVLFPIVPLLASQGLVVDLEVLHRSAILTSPVVTF